MNFLAAERNAKVAGSTFEGLNGDCGSVGGRGGQGGGGHPVDKEPRGPQLVFLNQLNQFLNIMPELLTERKNTNKVLDRLLASPRARGVDLILGVIAGYIPKGPLLLFPACC